MSSTLPATSGYLLFYALLPLITGLLLTFSCCFKKKKGKKGKAKKQAAGDAGKTSKKPKSDEAQKQGKQPPQMFAELPPQPNFPILAKDKSTIHCTLDGTSASKKVEMAPLEATTSVARAPASLNSQENLLKQTVFIENRKSQRSLVTARSNAQSNVQSKAQEQEQVEDEENIPEDAINTEVTLREENQEDLKQGTKSEPPEQTATATLVTENVSGGNQSTMTAIVGKESTVTALVGKESTVTALVGKESTVTALVGKESTVTALVGKESTMTAIVRTGSESHKSKVSMSKPADGVEKDGAPVKPETGQNNSDIRGVENAAGVKSKSEQQSAQTAYSKT